jgi:hypothetical protein
MLISQHFSPDVFGFEVEGFGFFVVAHILVKVARLIQAWA